MNTVIVTTTHRHAALDRLKGAIRVRFGPEEPGTASLQQAEQYCRDHNTEVVVVLVAPGHLDRALEVVRRLNAGPAAHVLVAGPATDPKLILRVMQAGADAFVDEADPDCGLDSAATRIARQHGGETPVGRLLAVLPAGGGSGASTVAVNLAALLAKARGRCHLIDLNPGKGDLGPLLDLTPQYTLADLCRNEARVDRAMYEKLLARGAGGVDLLAAPRELDDTWHLTAGHVGRALALARESFPDVVADLENCYRGEQVAALRQATAVFLVTRLTFTSVRNARRAIDHLAAQSIPPDRIKVVVNQHGLPGELPIGEAEQAIGRKLTDFIPHDPETVNAANNTGTPAVVRAPGSLLAESIGRLVGIEPPGERKSDLFRRVVPAVHRLIRPWAASRKGDFRPNPAVAPSPL